MNNSIFGEFTFDTGWKTKISIVLFGQSCEIVVKAKAFYEEDGITSEQEKAFASWESKKEESLKRAENLLSEYTNGNETERFKPRTLLFNRNGEYALLLDDEENEDTGIAIVLAPQEAIMEQDEYL